MHFSRIPLIAIIAESHSRPNTAQQIQSIEQTTKIASKTETPCYSFSTAQIAMGVLTPAAMLVLPATAAMVLTIRDNKRKESRRNGPETVAPASGTGSSVQGSLQQIGEEAANVPISPKTKNSLQVLKDGCESYQTKRRREINTERNVDKRLPPRNPKARFHNGDGVATYLDYHNHPQHSYWEKHKALQTLYRWLEVNIDIKDHMSDFPSQVKYNSGGISGDITESPIDLKLVLDFRWVQRREEHEDSLFRSIFDTKILYDLAPIIHKIIIAQGDRRSSYQKVGITPSCKDEDFDYAMASEPKQGEAHNDGYFEELFEFARASPQLLHLVWYGEDFDEIEYLAKQGVTGYTLEFDNWQNPSLFASYHTGQPGSPGVWGPIAAASAMGFKGVLHIRKRDLTLWQRDQVETFLEDLRTVASANKATQNAFTVEYDADIAVSYRSRTNGIGRTHVTSLDDFEAIISDGKEDSLSYPLTSERLDFTFSELWQEHLNSLRP